MNKFERISKPMMWSTTLLLAAIVTGCGGSNDGSWAMTGLGPIGSTCSGAGCVDLKTAGNYAVFANSGIHTDPGASVITGNIATGPAVTSSSITGFSLNLPAASPYSTSAQVSGKVYAFDYAPPTPTKVNTASLDMGTAYTNAKGGPAGATCPGSEFGGLTITKGVYDCAVNVGISTQMYLSGSSTDVFVFRITGTLNQASATQVTLQGVLPQNVFWVVSGATTIGSTAKFAGILMDQTAISMGHLSSINGRLLAQTAVNLDTTTVTQP